MGLYQEAEGDITSALIYKTDSINSYILLYDVKAALGKTQDLPVLTDKIKELYRDSDQNIIWELLKITDKFDLYQEGYDLLIFFAPKLTNYQKETNFLSLKYNFELDDLTSAAEMINKVLIDIASLSNEQKAMVYSLKAYFNYKANDISQSDSDLKSAEELYKYSAFVHYIKGRILMESGISAEGKANCLLCTSSDATDKIP